jgi:hypothetical protein
MSCGSTCIFIRSGLMKTTLTMSPNLLFSCSTSPFSKGGGSGCVLAGGDARLGLGGGGVVVVAADAAAVAEGGEGLAGICFG